MSQTFFYVSLRWTHGQMLYRILVSETEHAIPFKNLWDFFPQVLLTNVLVM